MCSCLLTGLNRLFRHLLLLFVIRIQEPFDLWLTVVVVVFLFGYRSATWFFFDFYINLFYRPIFHLLIVILGALTLYLLHWHVIVLFSIIAVVLGRIEVIIIRAAFCFALFLIRILDIARVAWNTNNWWTCLLLFNGCIFVVFHFDGHALLRLVILFMAVLLLCLNRFFNALRSCDFKALKITCSSHAQHIHRVSLLHIGVVCNQHVIGVFYSI